jgi:tRNA-modifying protein YgfZ
MFATFATPLRAIAVAGDDATTFLHGQLTNHVQSLPPGHAQRNAWCTAKGRMLANFWLVHLEAPFAGSNAKYLLLMPAELVDATLKRMRMFVLRSKCTFTPLDFSVTADGFREVSEPIAHYPIHATEAMISLPTCNGMELQIHAGQLTAPEDFASWESACVAAAEPWLSQATVDHFVPQMLNFDVLHGVHFQKGCYPGQEIVHRTKMIGRIRRRMMLALAKIPSGVSPPKAGDAIYSKQLGDQPAGMVVSASANAASYSILFSAMLEGVAANDLALAPHIDGVSTAPLTLEGCPYSVPELTSKAA